MKYVNKIGSRRENRRQEIAQDKGAEARVRSRASHVFSPVQQEPDERLEEVLEAKGDNPEKTESYMEYAGKNRKHICSLD